MDSIPICIHAEWDETAGVWVATSEDVPGLATEAAQLEINYQIESDDPRTVFRKRFADG